MIFSLHIYIVLLYNISYKLLIVIFFFDLPTIIDKIIMIQSKKNKF